MNPQTGSPDEGFTLIEMVIAVLIMGIAVVTIVGSLTTMIQLTAEHRGHAVIELASRSFGEAAQQQARFSTTLTGAVTTGTTTLDVADTSLLPRIDPADADNTYVSVDVEVMRVTAIAPTSLTVVRAINGVDTLAAHTSGTAVVPVLRCPSVAQLTPALGTYQSVTGVTSAISDVDYWDGNTNTFVDRNACTSAYDVLCDDPNSNGVFVLAECGWGYFRAVVDVTTPGDSRLRSVTTSTNILLRSGSG